MNVKSCEYLIAIAEKKTLSAAAKSLGISQPTLSTFLSNTERELRQNLFLRQQKEFVPTSAGLVYLDACRNIVEVKKRTYQSLLSLTGQHRDQFTIGVTPHRGSTMFSHAFAEFYRRYPDVSVNVKEGYFSALLAAMENKEADIVLGAMTEEDLEQYSVALHNKEELFLCVPDFHPLAALAGTPDGPRISIDIQQFQDTPFIMWGPETTNKKVVQTHLQQARLTPTTVYESNNVLLIDNMIRSGIGIGFLPGAYCKPGQHRVYFSLKPPLLCNIGICWRKDEALTKPQRYFMYLITKQRLMELGAVPPVLNDITRNILNEFKEES